LTAWHRQDGWKLSGDANASRHDAAIGHWYVAWCSDRIVGTGEAAEDCIANIAESRCLGRWGRIERALLRPGLIGILRKRLAVVWVDRRNDNIGTIISLGKLNPRNRGVASLARGSAETIDCRKNQKNKKPAPHYARPFAPIRASCTIAPISMKISTRVDKSCDRPRCQL
jgi:hypothetical protein